MTLRRAEQHLVVANQKEGVHVPVRDVEERDSAVLLDVNAPHDGVALDGVGIEHGEPHVSGETEAVRSDVEADVEVRGVSSSLVAVRIVVRFDVPLVVQDIATPEGHGEVALALSLGGGDVHHVHSLRRHDVTVDEGKVLAGLEVAAVDGLKDKQSAVSLHLLERGITLPIVCEVLEPHGVALQRFLGIFVFEHRCERDVLEKRLGSHVREDIHVARLVEVGGGPLAALVEATHSEMVLVGALERAHDGFHRVADTNFPGLALNLDRPDDAADPDVDVSYDELCDEDVDVSWDDEGVVVCDDDGVWDDEDVSDDEAGLSEGDDASDVEDGVSVDGEASDDDDVSVDAGASDEAVVWEDEVDASVEAVVVSEDIRVADDDASYNELYHDDHELPPDEPVAVSFDVEVSDDDGAMVDEDVSDDNDDVSVDEVEAVVVSVDGSVSDDGADAPLCSPSSISSKPSSLSLELWWRPSSTSVSNSSSMLRKSSKPILGGLFTEAGVSTGFDGFASTIVGLSTLTELCLSEIAFNLSRIC
ncbi:midasin, putative [Babesia ovata]|uniref:Midasin, putative n=1 Tax=Babesia ovata TaxID=189622 RepID=A0A2H6K6Q0_9APIC|nr:midasin, putative [Babesia ovata]GBE58666.1 midasin, putative [Babesia ovata]